MRFYFFHEAVASFSLVSITGRQNANLKNIKGSKLMRI